MAFYMRSIRRIIPAVCAALAAFCMAVTPLAAQTDDELFGGTSSDDALFGGSSDDDLFGSGDSLFEAPNPSAGSADSGTGSGGTTGSGESPSVSLTPAGVIFQAGSVRFGGSVTSKLDATVLWHDPYTGKSDPGAYFLSADAYIVPDLEASLFFDARPKENLRLYGKFNFAFPFELVIPTGTPGVAPLSVPTFTVFELFSDFSFKDTVYLRFGKHTVTWGVGYFFSPADVINLSVIDPEHPEKQREGPISLRTQISVPNTQTNVWLYLLPDTTTFKLGDTALAGKVDFLAGNYELGFGVWYKYHRSPRLTATVTGSIAGRVGVFAEGVAAWGTDAQWLNELALSAMRPVFQATIGAAWTQTKWKLTISGQYFYNGFGNSDAPALSIADWNSLKAFYGYTGRHYAAASIVKQEFLTRKLSAMVFAVFGFSDLSGMANARLTWEIFDNCSLSAGPDFFFGGAGGEYTRTTGVPATGVTLSFKLGGGKF